MSEQDNTPEHGEEPISSPAPEPTPEPVAAEAEPVAAPAEPEAVTEAVQEAVAESPPVAEAVSEVQPEAVAEPVPEEAPVPAASNEPVGVPESSNEPVAAEAHATEEATPAMPEPVVETASVETHVEPEPVVEAEAAAEPIVAAEAVEVVHEEIAPAAAEPVVEDVAEAVAVEPVQAEADGGIDPAVVAAGVAVAGAAAAAGAAATRPIWSDQGDAPFDDGATETPPARGGRNQRAKRESGGFFAEMLDIARTVVYALLIALVVRVFFFQPFTIPSASMEPNLYEGDYIIVSKWSYGYSRHSMPYSPPLFEGRILGQQAQRGDIVVFKRPNNSGEGYTDYIKRVIGLPGDTVQMIANRLYVNGTLVPDVVVATSEVRGALEVQTPIQMRETLPGGRTFRIQDFGPGSPADDTDLFTVPAGHYFVMGDNRDNSMDSRFVWEADGVGLVPAENLVGKAQIILFSWTPGASLLNPVTWFTHARPERFFINLE